MPYFSDTFTDTNGTYLSSHTPDDDTAGTGWTAVWDDYAQINSNSVWDSITGTSALRYTGLADGYIEVYTWQASGSMDNQIWFRWSNSINYLFVLCSTTSSEVQLWKRVGGTQTELTSASQSWGTTSTANLVRIEFSGSDIEVFVNGTSKLTYTESHNSTADKHGLMFNWQTRYDNLEHDSLASPGGETSILPLLGVG